MAQRRKRICFAQKIENAGRYQEWAKCLLDGFQSYAVRYNDFAPRFADADASFAKRALCKVDRIVKKARAIPPIVASDTVIFSNMGIDHRLFFLAHLLGKETIVDVYISQYQTLVLSRKTIAEDSRRAQRIFKRERYIFEHATKAVFLNESERDFYCQTVSCWPSNSFMIPLYNAPKREAEAGYFKGTKSRPCFCWWGGENNPLHGLPNIVRGLKLLEEAGQDFDFHIFGWDEQQGEDYYGRILHEVGWEDKVVPRYDLSMADGSLEEFLSYQCDIAFGPLSREPKALNVITNKALDAINMKIPLVMVDAPAMRAFFDDECVCYCDDVSPEGICRHLKSVLRDDRTAQRVSRAHGVLEKNFGTKKLNERFISMLEEKVER